jgi:ABC-2 type transport system permease protein
VSLDLLASELRRAWSRRFVRVTALLFVALGVALAVGFLVGSDPSRPDAFSLVKVSETGADLRGVLSVTAVFWVLGGLLVGASLTGAEYRAGTVTTWLTFEPRRVRALGTRLLAAAAVGLVLCFVAQSLSSVMLIPAAAFRGSTAGADSPFWANVLGFNLRCAVGVAAAVVAGGCLATLVKNTAGAIGIAFGYLVVVENVLGGIRPSWGKYFVLPNAVAALAGHDTQSFHGSGSVSPLQGVSLSLAYLAVLVAAACVVFSRRDVT